MLGRTNAVYKESEKVNELTLHSEVILTDITQDIKSIKYLSKTYIVFLTSGKMMYGSTLDELKYLKDGENYIQANYVIYHEGQYVFVSNKKIYSPANQNWTAVTPAHAYLYKTSDLVNFQTLEINLGDVTIKNVMNINGFFINSKGKIVVLLSERPDKLWYGTFDNIEDIKVKSDFVMLQNTNYMKFDSEDGLRNKATMYKDNIFINTSDKEYIIISPEGTWTHDSVGNKANFLYDDVYLKYVSDNSGISIYDSYNGLNWKLLGTLNSAKKVLLHAWYEGDALGMFIRAKDDSVHFSYVETRKNIISAYDNKIDVEETGLNGVLNCSLRVGDYTYIGSNGGIIYKTWVDYSGGNLSPEISVIKTLAARQALREANAYTDQKYAELENRIALLESNKDTH